jgi:spore coat polysaccharide biosynthesis predicted glycosyltransferase SpsG
VHADDTVTRDLHGGGGVEVADERQDGGVLVVCDVGPTLGVGHVMRCLALAEELASRGRRVLFCADVGSVPWAAEQLSVRRIPWVPAPTAPAGFVARAREHAASLVVIDSYLLGAEVYSAMRADGLPVLALVDGDLGGRPADLYLDQNIDAEKQQVRLPAGSARLAGLRYALMRDEILQARGTGQAAAASPQTPRVFAFFGGTDAFGAGPVVARSLVATGSRFAATFVAGNPASAEALTSVRPRDGQTVEVIGPTSRLVEHVRAADLVLSAAGTSTWELMCMGAAVGLVCVADNQHLGYQRVLQSGAAAGLGLLEEMRSEPEPSVGALRCLLAEPAARARLRDAARRLVDGRGRIRVADASLKLVGRRAGREGLV